MSALGRARNELHVPLGDTLLPHLPGALPSPQSWRSLPGSVLPISLVGKQERDRPQASQSPEWGAQLQGAQAVPTSGCTAEP